MTDFNSYKQLLLSMIDLNYKILKIRNSRDMLITRELAVRLYTEFEQCLISHKFDDDQLFQLELLFNQLNETNDSVIKLLKRKAIILKIQQRIRQDRVSIYLD